MITTFDTTGVDEKVGKGNLPKLKGVLCFLFSGHVFKRRMTVIHADGALQEIFDFSIEHPVVWLGAHIFL